MLGQSTYAHSPLVTYHQAGPFIPYAQPQAYAPYPAQPYIAQPSQQNVPPTPEPPQAATLQGRKYSSPCITLNRILIVITLVGAIILALSLLVLIAATSQTGQYVSFLSKVNNAATIFAAKFSTNPLTISIWGVTTGGCVFFGGGITLFIDYIRRKEHLPQPHEPLQTNPDKYS